MSRSPTVSAVEVSAMLLVKMKEIAERHLEGDVNHAVITVPANFDDAQRQMTKDAAIIAGLNCLRIINEPTASALVQLTHHEEEAGGERPIIVFDFGAGTCDVSLLIIEYGIAEVLGTAGDMHLGGRDITNRLMDKYWCQLLKQHPRIASASSHAKASAQRRLWTACEKAKRDLSSASKAHIRVSDLCEGVTLTATLNRKEFEDMNEDIFLACMRPVEKVLRDTKYGNFGKNQVREIILVGGSSRIPKLRDMLQACIGGAIVPNSRHLHPEEAIAHGAAIQAALLTNRNQSEKLNDMLLLDVQSITLGLGTINIDDKTFSMTKKDSDGNQYEIPIYQLPSSTSDGEGHMTAVIKRNTTIPTEKKSPHFAAEKSDRFAFSTCSDNQSSVLIQVYEGEGAMTRDCNLLGEFHLGGIPPMPRGVPQIEVTFDIDADGTLNVSAIEKSTEKENKITITNDAGHLSKDEIERMVAEEERRALERGADARRAEARNGLESYAFALKNTVNDPKQNGRIIIISETDKATVLRKVKSTIAWLDESGEYELEEYEEKQNELEGVAMPVMQRLYGGGGTGDDDGGGGDNDGGGGDSGRPRRSSAYFSKSPSGPKMSLRDMKAALDSAGVDYSKCLERTEFETLYNGMRPPEPSAPPAASPKQNTSASAVHTPAPSAPPAPPSTGGAAPSLSEWLADPDVRLTKIAGKLADFGAEVVADLLDLDDEDINCLQLKKLEVKRLKRALKALKES